MEPAGPVWSYTRNSTESLQPYFIVQSSHRATVTQIQEDGEINANPLWGSGNITLQEYTQNDRLFVRPSWKNAICHMYIQYLIKQNINQYLIIKLTILTILLINKLTINKQ